MIGKQIAHYEILDTLGKGTMGQVYRARDTKLDRQVALKLMPADAATDSELLHRFRREARALAALDHPNIVSVHSVDEADGHHFLTMGLVEGRSLDGHIPARGMSAERWLEFATAIAEGLAAAHGKGVIHRDLKPANIMVTPAGKVKIIDFGLVKHTYEEADGDKSLCLTQSGVVVGTIPYMSPEQLKGQPVDARSDIFSLGILLYEMATGQRPFTGESGPEVIAAILNDDPLPPTGAAVECLAVIDHVLSRCLPKDPTQRYPSVTQLLRELCAPEGAHAVSGPVYKYTMRDAPSDPLGELMLPSRPSLAVLPFVNLGGDPDGEQLANGLWFDLHAELVKLSGLFLLSVGSTSTYKGRSPDPCQVGKELGVRHVLEGGVRRIGNRVRLTVQLVATDTGLSVWADRYDHDIEDLFALQDEVNLKILEALDVKLLHGEGSVIMHRDFQVTRARDLFYQALPSVFSPRLDDLLQARRLLTEVEEIEPGTFLVPSHAGWTYYFEGMNRLGSDQDRLLVEADACAKLGIERGDPGGLAYMLQATLLLARGEHDAARGAGEVALSRRPSCPWAYAVFGSLLNYVGEPDRGAEFASMSFRLSPLTPHFFPAVMATSYYLAERAEQAVTAARKALELDADSLDTHVILAASLVAAGRAAETDGVLADIRRVRPDFRLEAYVESQPYKHQDVLARLTGHLRQAGL